MSTAKHTPTLLSKEELYEAKELCVSMGECSATYYIVMLIQEAEWRRQIHDDLLKALRNAQALYPCEMYAKAISKAEGGAL
jgi:hypothetical protein